MNYEEYYLGDNEKTMCLLIDDDQIILNGLIY